MQLYFLRKTMHIKGIMARFIVFLDKVINLYLYFIIMACFLGWVPNINPNYPLFHYIFKLAGFYIIPPIFGIYLSPAIVMVCIALISAGLHKIYEKYYLPKKPQVIVMSAKDFFEKADEFSKEKETPERKDDENND